MNSYFYNSTDKVLEVTQVEGKTLEEVKHVIALNKPQAVIDKFIELYLPTTDANQAIVDDWYNQNQLVKTLNKAAPKKDIVNSNGVVTGKQPNAYDTAITARKALESTNAWLKGLRGLNAPLRPVFVIDVAKFKADNAILFDTLNKRNGVNLNGVQVSLTEVNQNGLAAVITGVNLATAAGLSIFPLNFKAETNSGSTLMPFANETELTTFALQFLQARQAFFQ